MEGPMSKTRSPDHCLSDENAGSHDEHHVRSQRTGNKCQFADTFRSIVSLMFEPCDPAGLGIARSLFGILMFIDVFEERGLLYVTEKWGDPEVCYFPLFSFITRLPLAWTYIVYGAMLLASVCIAVGFLYRLNCVVYCLGYWYLFLLDTTVWNNHSYLYGLLAMLFLVTDAHHYWSLDGLLFSVIRNKCVPRWNYGILRFQMFLVYFYAGVKKLDSDWVGGYSMQSLGSHWIFDPFRIILNDERINFYIVHIGGLFIDLSAGFLLLGDRTRILGFLMAYSFHIMNAVLFNIGMFSYVCMAMITIFCKPSWPKQIFKIFPSFIKTFRPACVQSDELLACRISKGPNEHTTKSKTTCTLVLLYMLMQVLLPWSHSLSQGYNCWTQGLYGYSWDMMVHSWTTQHVVIKIADAKNGNVQFIRPGAFLPNGDIGHRVFSHPDMLKSYAVCLADRIKHMSDLNVSHPKVYIDVWKSMNKRYQQRMFDPTVDLAAAPWSPFKPAAFVQPLLIELSHWRDTLIKLESYNRKVSSESEVVFVADFPGFSLENFIANEISANLTILRGEVALEINGVNRTMSFNETASLPSNATHVVHTVSDNPACFMYHYYNHTWVDSDRDDLLRRDPGLQEKIRQREDWIKKTLVEKVFWFFQRKLENYRTGVYQLFWALEHVFDIRSGEKEGVGDIDENGEL